MRNEPRLERWVDALLQTPGLTALRDRAAIVAELLEDSLSAAALVARESGGIVDVGSGGGAPGIPLAAALPEREVTLLEATGWKCAFLERLGREFPNVRVVHGRAEEQGLEAWGVAVAKALAPPVVAAEWLLPLVALGGAAILYLGEVPPELPRVAGLLGGSLEEVVAVPGRRGRHLAVLRKVGPTPAGFPRRSGVARKRPLA